MLIIILRLKSVSYYAENKLDVLLLYIPNVKGIRHYFLNKIDIKCNLAKHQGPRTSTLTRTFEVKPQEYNKTIFFKKLKVECGDYFKSNTLFFSNDELNYSWK